MKRCSMITLLAGFLICAVFSSLNAQALENRVNIVFGLSQLSLGGYNVEGNIMFKRFIFDYSHGVSLNMNNEFLEEGPDKANGLDIHIPWTTGFGLGYRFTNWLNVRAEPKWHKFELYDGGAMQVSENILGEYTTFTLGLGAYANLRPFKNANNFLKGIMIVPNVRWWPKVGSSLDNDSLSISTNRDDQEIIHVAREIGIANTPFFINASIGYSIRF